MKLLLSQIQGLRARAIDGNAGRINDLYYDDSAWSVRHLILRLPGIGARFVSTRPEDLDLRSLSPTTLNLSLSRQQILSCPDRDETMPVSRQKTLGLSWLWPDPLSTGISMPPSLATGTPAESGDPHLRSFTHTRHYFVGTNQGILGRLEDFFIDGQFPRIGGVLVKLGSAFSHRIVLAPPSWLGAFDWAQGTAWSSVHPSTWRGLSTFHSPVLGP